MKQGPCGGVFLSSALLSCFPLLGCWAPVFWFPLLAKVPQARVLVLAVPEGAVPVAPPLSAAIVERRLAQAVSTKELASILFDELHRRAGAYEPLKQHWPSSIAPTIVGRTYWPRHSTSAFNNAGVNRSTSTLWTTS